MLVFLDFEASSLGKRGFPVEVGWVFEDGSSEAHLIRPAPGWDEWDASAAAIHGIGRAMLTGEGEPHDAVAQRMVETLTGHDLLASAPSWDGKWLSALLRAAGLPRHTLRLRDSDDAILEAARAPLAAVLPVSEAEERARVLVAQIDRPTTPAHRALADALAERALWLAVGLGAAELAASLAPR